MRFLPIFKCGLRFRAAVFGFCQNLDAAFGFSKPLGLRYFAFFIRGLRFLDAVFGFCLILDAASGIFFGITGIDNYYFLILERCKIDISCKYMNKLETSQAYILLCIEALSQDA